MEVASSPITLINCNFLQLLPQLLQRCFLHSGHLGLGDADLGGDLHLGLVLVVAQGYDLLLAGGEGLHRLAEGDVFQPGFVGGAAGGIGELVDDVKGVSVFRENGLVDLMSVDIKLQSSIE